MRPIKLTMTGFETYCDRTVVDFTKLGTNGLYLITGETGAGKTTIFDAITFALYGGASGQTRSEAMLRSHFADDTIPTEVELVFETQGQTYTVIRNPEYERKRIKGEGTTIRKADATLVFSDSRAPVTGKENVTREIESILKLKKKEFCSIAMIAQGAFQKLLLESTEEKQKIFRELFNTDKYDLLQKRLKEDVSNLNNQIQATKKSMEQHLNSLVFDEENGEKLKEIQNLGIIQPDDIKFFEDYLKKENKRLKKNDEQSAILQKELQIITEQYNNVKTLQEKEENLKATEEQLLKNEGLLKEIKLELNENQKEFDKLPSLQQEIGLLEDSIGKFKDWNNNKAQLEKDKIELKNKDAKLIQIKQDLEQKKKDLFQISVSLESLNKSGEYLIKAQNELQNIESTLRELQDLNKKISDLKDLEETQKNVTRDYLDAECKYNELFEDYKHKRLLFLREQAGILAEDLVENEPCPVCGSLTHPNPAHKATEAPSEEVLNKAEELYNQANKDLKLLSEKRSGVSSDINNLTSLVNSVYKKIFSCEFDKNNSDTSVLSEIETRKKLKAQKEEDIKKAERDVKQKESLEEKKPELEKEIETLTEQVQSSTQEITSLKATLEQVEKVLLEQEKEFDFNSINEADKKLDDLKGKIRNIEKLQSSLQTKKIEIEKENSGFEGKINLLKKDLAEKTEIDFEELSQKKQEKENLLAHLSQERDELNKRMGINENSVNQLKILSTTFAQISTRFAKINALAEATSGSIKEKEKISLEIFVQCAVLDRITHYANMRLRIMTAGQYELVRCQDATNHSKKFGLDLDVIDFYTGRRRGVESLSGGEQFQASLALALGLADEIQNSSGGIRLDSMFIDEGFGTLDPETLNKAMKALEELSRGDKLVGIISHVEALEEKIDRKIIVKKGGDGKSFLKIV